LSLLPLNLLWRSVSRIPAFENTHSQGIELPKAHQC